MNAPGSFVTPGMPVDILAQDFNDWQQAAKFVKGGMGGASASSVSGNDDDTIPFHWSGYDGTNENLERFGVVRIAHGPAILPSDNLPAFQNQIALTDRTSTWNFYHFQGRFGIIQEPMARIASSGQVCPFRKVKLNGITPCKVNFSNGNFIRADVVAVGTGQNNPQLYSHCLTAHPGGSASILWRSPAAETDGTYWCLVNLSYDGWWTRPMFGVTTEAIGAGSSGIVSVQGMNMDVYNPWQSTAAASGVRCWVGWEPITNGNGGRPKLISHECGA